MIDLRALAEYGRRSGAHMPPQLFLSDAPHNPLQESAALIGAWLGSWDEIDPETRDLLAGHLGFGNQQALHAELMAQGMTFVLELVRVHGDLPSRFEALRRAVREGS